MNKKEIYDEIECCTDELKQKDSEEEEKHGVFLDLYKEVEE